MNLSFKPDSYIDQLSEHQGQKVKLCGWVYKMRSSGKVLFIVLRDGTGLCQCVVEKSSVSEDLFDQLRHIGQESSIMLSGTVRVEPRSPGGYELAVNDGAVIGASSDYPITPKSHGIDFLMRHRHLHFRSHQQWCIGRVRHTVIDSIRRFFNDNGFMLIDTPIFTTIAGEGEQTLFKVDYFDDKLHLAQTGQLYLESAAMSYGRVYCFGPTFRAEKSKTRRHLTEFWMVEPEVAFVDLEGLLSLAENFVSFVVGRVLDKHRSDLEELGADIEGLEKIKPPFVRLKYSEAVDILKGPKAAEFLAAELAELNTRRDEVNKTISQLEDANSQQGVKKWQKDKNVQQLIELRSELSELNVRIENNPAHAALAADFQWGSDLGGSDETIISNMHDRPVFVTHYPKQVKAFYMKADQSEPSVVENFDLLAPAGFGEIIGGSMREDDHDTLLARINEKGYNPESYSWYLDLRKYGSVPHGGFGLGVERTVAWITGQKHIRQCIPFPRMMDKVYI